MKLRKGEVQKDEVQERLSGRSKKVKLSKSKMQNSKVQEKVKSKKGGVRKDREGGLPPKHALECLRHGADRSAYGKFRTVPGWWVKVSEECYEEVFAAVWMRESTLSV